VDFKKKLGKVARADRALKGAATFSIMTFRKMAVFITMKKALLAIRIKRVHPA
jgi:hypothetical protein